MKKSLLLVAVVLLLAGCTTSKSLTLKVTTEKQEDIKVKLNTTDGLDMKQDGNELIFSKDDKEVASSNFQTKANCDAIFEQIATITTVEVFEENDDIVFYFYEGEYIHLSRIEDGNACFALKSSESEKLVEEIYENLTITVE